MEEAAKAALSSGCLHTRCGSVVVKEGRVIGTGCNSPPCRIKLEKCIKDELPKEFRSDETCCVHAEQRAVYDSLKNNSDKLSGSRIYFIKLEKGSDRKRFSGRPYCTHCSKLALDSGISEFVLWHKEGICAYDTKEYNELSFKYREEP